MIEEKEIEKTREKHKYFFAFLFGMILMLVAYVLFESATQPGYRVQTGIDEKEDSLIIPASTERSKEVEPSAYLGIEILDIDLNFAKQLNLSSQAGVLINSVVSDSPAETAGLERGDVMIGFNNRTVKDSDHFKELISVLEPGDRVKVVILRDSRKQSLYAVLDESPALKRTAMLEETANSSDWGVVLSPITDSIRNMHNIPEDIGGVAILSVVPGSKADSVGMMPGDVIRGIDKTTVTDMESFFTAVSSDDDNTCLLDLYSDDMNRYVAISSLNLLPQDKLQDSSTIREKLFSIFTGGTPFADDDEEEGPKGGKFAEDDISLTTGDNPAFNRPSTVPGDVNTGGMGPSDITGMNRPTEVPPQLGGPENDIVLFVGLLILIILYLSYREFHRPPEID